MFTYGYNSLGCSYRDKPPWDVPYLFIFLGSIRYMDSRSNTTERKTRLSKLARNCIKDNKVVFDRLAEI